MTMNFFPVFYDSAHDIFRIPPAVLADLEDNSLDLSCDNGRDLLLLIGVTETFGVKPLDAFARQLAEARQADLRARNGDFSPAIPLQVDEQAGRITVVHCGRRAGYLEERLTQLSSLVERVRDLGATHISWG